MYCYRFPSDINKLLDGRAIRYVAKEIRVSRERLSKVLRGVLLCNENTAEKLITRLKPNEKITDYFKLMSESEVNKFYAKRDM